MDFLVSASEPGEQVRRRYDHTHSSGSLWMGYVSSGNLTVVEQTGDVVAVVAGSLFGPLARADQLQTLSPRQLGTNALESDGSFAVAIPREESVTVVTDAGESIPVYYGHGPAGWAVGTLVHHVASASGLESIDKISAVDFLFNGTVCYPYSWYKDVRLVPPGSVCAFDSIGMDCHTYWTPTEPPDLYEACDEREWGERLRKQVRSAVERGISDQKTGRVLYSGGTDSRAILSLVPDSFPCTPTTVLDQKNREYRLANRSARLLGRDLEWIPRPDGFYRTSIEDRIDRIGPGWDFLHMHFFGTVADRLQDTDVVLGGYLADTLFKTPYMCNVEERRRRPASLLDPLPDWILHPNIRGGRMGNAALWNDRAAAALERRLEHHKRLKEHRPLTAGNWHSLWPLAGQRTTYAQYLSNLRMDSRVIEPFFVNQSYRLAAKMPDTCRVDHRAFRHAFAAKMGPAGLCPTSSGQVPRLGGYPGSLTSYYIDRWRFWSDRIGNSVGPQGSWPSDHHGWHPVRPDEHFPEANQTLLRNRLGDLLAEGQASRFFDSGGLSNKLRVRALALAFDGP